MSENAASQAQAQFDSIKKMVEELNAARESDDCGAVESAERRIYEDALSVEVRSNWHTCDSDAYNEEFRILLCTGGPAVQIVGTLSEHNEPESAHLEFQDWGIPWTVFHQSCADRDILVEYARTFYFGE